MACLQRCCTRTGRNAPLKDLTAVRQEAWQRCSGSCTAKEPVIALPMVVHLLELRLESTLSAEAAGGLPKMHEPRLPAMHGGI